MKQLRNTLKLTSLAGLAVALAACEPEEKAMPGEPLALPDMAGLEGWPVDELEGEAPPFEMPLQPVSRAPQPAFYASAPMTARPSGAYRYAPEYDYPDHGYYHDRDGGHDYYDDGPGYYHDSPSADSYAWLGLASLLGGVIANSPPDYYFDYHGVQPWVWRTHDRYVRFAEPLRTGYRYYYYEPGAYRPFLVRDPHYSYGYRNDRLVVIYDDRGRVLDGRRAWHQRRAARWHFDRGRDLYRAAHRGDRHGVAAPHWVKYRKAIARDQRAWDRARKQRAEWRRWENRRERAVERRWNEERIARWQAEQRFARWQRTDFRTSAPSFYEAPRERFEHKGNAERKRAIKRRQEIAHEGNDRFERAERRRDLQRARHAQASRSDTWRERLQRKHPSAVAERAEARERPADRRQAAAQRRAIAENRELRQQRLDRAMVASRAVQQREAKQAWQARQQQAKAAQQAQRRAQREAAKQRQAQLSHKARQQAEAAQLAQAKRQAAQQRQAQAVRQQQRAEARQRAARQRAQAQRQAAQQRAQAASQQQRQQAKARKAERRQVANAREAWRNRGQR
jgi:hypothetical protein